MAALRPPSICPPSLSRRASFPSAEDVASFRTLGSTQFDRCLSIDFVLTLREGIERALRGIYEPPDSQPDRSPKLVKRPLSDALSNPLGFGGTLPKDGRTTPVVQIVNLYKANESFKAVATSPIVASFVARMCGWEKCGVRLANDQLWGKGPKGAPLAFHRDDPYFMFKRRGDASSTSDSGEMDEVATLWFTLDELDPEVGPLEFCDRSHLWESAPGFNGTLSNFFVAEGGKPTKDEATARRSGSPGIPPSSEQHKNMLFSAAKEIGLLPSSLSFSSTVGLPPGGGSLHSGKLWHGSAANSSEDKVRRGYGVHFFRGDLVWSVPDARRSKLFAKYVEADVKRAGNPDAEECEISCDDFPFVFPPGGHAATSTSSSPSSSLSAPSVSSTDAAAASAAAATDPLDFSALSTSVAAEERIRNDRPSVKVALKNFLSLALTKSMLRAPPPSKLASPADKLRIPSLLSSASRDILKLLNSGPVSLVPSASSIDTAGAAAMSRLYSSVRATPDAKAADLFGRSILKTPCIRQALSAMYEDEEEEGSDPRVIDLALEHDKRLQKDFVDAFLESAFFDEPREQGGMSDAEVDEGKLVWSKDFDAELKKRHGERKERAKERVNDIERRKNEVGVEDVVEDIGAEGISSSSNV